jgi:hypothetical protein
MTWFRRIVFVLFAGAYLIVCPLTILYALGYAVRPGTGGGWVKTGLISIRSLPEGATLYLEGRRFARRTPAVVNELRPGPYRVKVALRGYAPWQRTVRVQAQRASTFDHILLLPNIFPVRRHLAGPFDQLAGIRGTPYLLLVPEPKTRELFVYDWSRGEALHLNLAGAEAAVRAEDLLSMDRSSQVLAHARMPEGMRWLSLQLDRPMDDPVDVSRLLPRVPDQIAWDAGRPETLYALREGALDRLDIAAMTLRPRIAEGVRAFAARDDALYLLDEEGALVRAKRDGTVTATLLRDLRVGRGRFGFAPAVTLQALPGGLVIAQDSFGQLLVTNGTWTASAERVDGVDYDPAQHRLLAWGRDGLGVLELPDAPRGRSRRPVPAVRWLSTPVRSIRQAHWVYDGSHVLWVERGTVWLRELEAEPQEPARRIAELGAKEWTLHYADERGTLYFLDDDGSLASIELVPGRERGLFTLPELPLPDEAR